MYGCTSNETKIIKAIKLNDVESVKAIVQNDVDINCKTKDQTQILLDAVLNGKLEIAKILIENEADVNIINSDGNSLLSVLLGCSIKDQNIVKKIFEDTTPYNILIQTPINQKIEIIKTIIKSDLGLLSSKNYSELQLAIYLRDFEIFKSILAKTKNIDYQNYYHETALIIACKNNYWNMAEELIREGANINISENKDYSPLYYAMKSENFQFILFLIEYDVDIDNIYGMYVKMGQSDFRKVIDISPISLAMYRGELEIAKKLYDSKSTSKIEVSCYDALLNNDLHSFSMAYLMNINGVQTDQKLKTELLFKAIELRYNNFVFFFDNNKFDIYFVRNSESNNSTLYAAVINDNKDIAKYLIENGPEIYKVVLSFTLKMMMIPLIEEGNLEAINTLLSSLNHNQASTLASSSMSLTINADKINMETKYRIIFLLSSY
jgi:ankyrin repeat protein